MTDRQGSRGGRALALAVAAMLACAAPEAAHAQDARCENIPSEVDGRFLAYGQRIVRIVNAGPVPVTVETMRRPFVLAPGTSRDLPITKDVVWYPEGSRDRMDRRRALTRPDARCAVVDGSALPERRIGAPRRSSRVADPTQEPACQNIPVGWPGRRTIRIVAGKWIKGSAGDPGHDMPDFELEAGETRDIDVDMSRIFRRPFLGEGLLINVVNDPPGTPDWQRVLRPDSFDLGSDADACFVWRSGTDGPEPVRVPPQPGSGTAEHRDCTQADLDAALASDAASDATSGTIGLDGGCRYLLSSGLEQAVTLRGPITLEGNGAIVERATGAPAFRLLRTEGDVTIRDLTLRDGSSSKDGGAIYADGPLTLERTTFEGNAADELAGAVFGLGAHLTIRGSRFLDNRSKRPGGAVLYEGSGSLKIESSLFANNRVDTERTLDGAAVHAGGKAGTVEIDGVTIADVAGNSARAISVWGGKVALRNSIISGHAVGLAVGSKVEGSEASHTLFADVSVPVQGLHQGVVAFGSGNIRSPWAGFADPAAGDFTLSSVSGAIDKGTQRGPARDLSNASRPFPHTMRDLGAYEFPGQGTVALTIAKKGPAWLQPGQDADFTIEIGNDGSRAARSLTVTEVLPPSASYVADSASDGGTLSGRTLTWTLSRLAPGARTRLTYRAGATADIVSREIAVESAVDPAYRAETVHKTPLKDGIVANLGFFPRPDGYAFPNWGKASLQTDLPDESLVRIFGRETACKVPDPGTTCVPRGTIRQWRRKWLNFMEGGHCAGMAMSSINIFASAQMSPKVLQSRAESTFDVMKPNARRDVTLYATAQIQRPRAAETLREAGITRDPTRKRVVEIAGAANILMHLQEDGTYPIRTRRLTFTLAEAEGGAKQTVDLPKDVVPQPVAAPRADDASGTDDATEPDRAGAPSFEFRSEVLADGRTFVFAVASDGTMTYRIRSEEGLAEARPVMDPKLVDDFGKWRGDPREILELLRENLADPEAGDRFRIAFSRHPDDGGGHGHTVVPFAVERLESGKNRIYVYENNRPDNIGLAILVDEITGEWSYTTQTNPSKPFYGYRGDPFTGNLRLTSWRWSTAFPMCPDGGCKKEAAEKTAGADGASAGTVTVQVSGPVQPLVTRSDGARVGFDAATRQHLSEIPDAEILDVSYGGIGSPGSPALRLPHTAGMEYEVSLFAGTAEGGAASVTTDAWIAGPDFSAGVTGLVVPVATEDGLHAPAPVSLAAAPDAGRIGLEGADQAPSVSLAVDVDGGTDVIAEVAPFALRAGSFAMAYDASTGLVEIEDGETEGAIYLLSVLSIDRDGAEARVDLPVGEGVHDLGTGSGPDGATLRAANYPDRMLTAAPDGRVLLAPESADPAARFALVPRPEGGVSLRVADGSGRIVAAGADGVALRAPDAVAAGDTTRFLVRDGLAGEGVSFEAADMSGRYLRHSGFVLRLDARDGTELFDLDATFASDGAR